MFITIPTRGLATIVDQHPTPAIISDALGGAVPVGIGAPGASLAMMVRETAATEGLDRNQLAEFGAFFGTGRAVPMLGPVVWVGWQAAYDAGDGGVMGEPICLPAEVAAALVAMVNGVRHALDGNEHLIDPEEINASQQWLTSVREVARKMSEMTVPEHWPYSPQTVKARSGDPLFGLFRKLGIRVRPEDATI